MTESSVGREGEGASGLWGGRFSGGPTPEMTALNDSLPEDGRLWRQDVEGSRAWARALGEAGVLEPGEVDALVQGLDQVEERLAGGIPEDATDEDIHSLVERLLVEAVGDVGRKLHTGRSRNDQVATDLRLWGMDALRALDVEVGRLARALADLAERSLDVVIPAYTHLQQAQPIRAGHWALSHAWPLVRDRERLRRAAASASVLPLGCGAVAGCPFPVDRRALARELGFKDVSPNSVDAVRDRDWVVEAVSAGALLGVHLSNLGEDSVIFASLEFGWLRFSDQYSTGSSLMPQKRNPDAAELARGKAGRLAGNLVALVTLLKGLPTGYNKDLQEDKARLFDTVDTLSLVLPAMTGAMATATVDAERASQGLEPGMLATEVADYLVERGVPFRTAHEVVGRLVARAEADGVGLSQLSLKAFQAEHQVFGPDVFERFSWERAVESRSLPGGTARSAVETQLADLRARLSALDDASPTDADRIGD